MKSKLQQNPRSEILKPGYINIYSDLNPKELRQHNFKSLYKKQNPKWDETLVYLSVKFEELVKNNSVVLDAGCGNGNYIIDENRKMISWAVGVDLSKEFISKNICLDEIKIASLEKLPFENNCFDAVLLLWVLEHLKNPKRVFDEIYRVLKSGGYFFFATPNKNFFPLGVLHLVKLGKINTFLNKVLFGREEEDVFEAYYKVNTVEDISKLIEGKFEIETLRLNYDPGYISFSKLSYFPSNFVHTVFAKLKFSFTYPHIIGVLFKHQIHCNNAD